MSTADQGIGTDEGRGELPLFSNKGFAFEAGWKWGARVFHDGPDEPESAQAEALIESPRAGLDLQRTKPDEGSMLEFVLKLIGLDHLQPGDPMSEAFFAGASSSWHEHVSWREDADRHV